MQCNGNSNGDSIYSMPISMQAVECVMANRIRIYSMPMGKPAFDCVRVCVQVQAHAQRALGANWYKILSFRSSESSYAIQFGYYKYFIYYKYLQLKFNINDFVKFRADFDFER